MALKKYQILWTKNFKNELNSIYNYIFVHLKNPIAAENVHSKIIKALHSLQYFPSRHSKVNMMSQNGKKLQKIVVDNYIIIYEIDVTNLQIFILHIFCKGQNYIERL